MEALGRDWGGGVSIEMSTYIENVPRRRSWDESSRETVVTAKVRTR
jgi:hypothetical protein